MIKLKSPTPLPVQRSLAKLGKDLRDARIRRRISSTVMAHRALTTRATLHRAEQGDPRVAASTYATLIYVLGMSQRLEDLADIRHDAVGLALDAERLPKRIRSAAIK